MIPKQTRIRDRKHRLFLSTLPCAVSGLNETQAAHISTGRYSMGMKSCDSNCISLNWREHQRQHSMSEAEYWEPYGGIEKARELAKLLYQNTGNEDECIWLLARFRNGDL